MEGDLEKISKILGKPVISIFDGTVEGYVKNVFADKKLCKVLWLCVFDDESQEEKLVETKNVYSFCEDAVMIKNNAGTYLLGTVDLQEINPIGYKIYQLNGKQKNKIQKSKQNKKQLKKTVNEIVLNIIKFKKVIS